MTRRFAAWAQACGLLFMATGMALAWFAVLRFFVPALSQSLPLVALGFVLYAGVASLGIVLLRRLHRRRGARVFLLVIMGASLLIQTGLIFSTRPDWTGPIDAELFRHFLNQLSENGYTPKNLETLSQLYDYPLWTTRAVPVHLAIRICSGTHFIRAIQFFQALLLTLSLAVTWRIAGLLFDRHVAFWATTLQFLMPHQALACLDLNHHVTGVFYFLSALWILAKWFQPALPLRRALGLALCAGLLVPLMQLGGGMHQIYAAAALGIILLLRLGHRQTTCQSLGAVLGLLVLPLLVAALVTTPLARRLTAANVHRLSSGAVGFMARGWMPETGGEYSSTYERIDLLTPRPEKKSSQAALLASQAFYNPQVLLLQLFPTKLAKYFLLGYASSAEELFARNGADAAAALAKGARTAFLLGVLPLMTWGVLLLLPSLGNMKRLPLILPCSIFCVAILGLGETSPRYSSYITPFLFMLAALPMAWALHRRRLVRAAVRPGLTAALSLGGILLLVAGALAGARPWLHSRAFEDLRTWSTTNAQTRTVPATLAPFEIQLLPESGGEQTTWGPVQFPAAPLNPGRLRFYTLPQGVPSDQLREMQLVLEVATPDGIQIQTNPAASRVELDCTPGMPGTLTWRTTRPLPFPLSIGYASVSSNPPRPAPHDVD